MPSIGIELMPLPHPVSLGGSISLCLCNQGSVRAHARLPPELKLALLHSLVDGASQSAAAARAAEHQHAAHLAAATQVAEYSTERGAKQAKGEVLGTQVAAVRAELAHIGAERKKSGGGKDAAAVPSPGEGISGSEGARVRETVARLGERHGLMGASGKAVAVLTRDALELTELDLLLEVELQCTPVDPLGRRRLPKALWQAEAIKHD